jgi:hypothetical protein
MLWFISPKMQQPSVFVIKRAYTDTCFSIKPQNRPRPCVLVFENKKDAQYFRGAIRQTQDSSRPHQKLNIEQLTCQYLYQSCSLNSLDIYVYNTGGSGSLVTPAMDEDLYRFNLENAFHYH